MLATLSTMRQEWIRKLLDVRRDVDAECQHPSDITIEDYVKAYTRRDISGRIVRLMPEESWVDDPEIYETDDPEKTEFEKEWGRLEEEFHIYSTLQRADILSGVGRFGILIIGADDGGKLEDPLSLGGGSKKPTRKLLYLRPFDESNVTVKTLERDSTSPRYGLPVTYEVEFAEVDSVGSDITRTGIPRLVHWSRAIHLADNRTSSDVYGEPRLKLVYNRILDLMKVSGGSAEMFWKGGFPGLSLEALPDAVKDGSFQFGDAEKTATKEQIESYQQGLQRYLALVGMSAKSLTVEVADPRPHAEIQLKLIATAMGVPWRVLIGSESAELASSQDMVTWNKRLNRRRTKYVEPFIIRPLIDRLMEASILPFIGEAGYQVSWRDLNTPSEAHVAEVAEKKSSAIAKYVQGTGDLLIEPFHFLTLVLGMTDKQAEAIVKATSEHISGGSPLLTLRDRKAAVKPGDGQVEDSNFPPTGGPNI